MRAENVLKFMIISVFSLLFFSFVFSIQNVVYATEGVCTPITGRSTPIPPNTLGTPMNEGVFDFEVYTGASRGCVHEQEAIGQQEFVLKGWVWNTNLGWISLGSFANENVRSTDDLVDLQDGSPAGFVNGVNRGVSTGNIAYSSIALVTDSENLSGYLNGYWWGDNTGWISLNCEPYYAFEVGVMSAEHPCVQIDGGATRWGVSFSTDVNGDQVLSGYAWSNSVGWIDMDGVILNLELRSLEDVSAVIQVVSPNSIETVYANGEDGLVLRVRFLQDGTNVTDSVLSFADSTNTEICLELRDDRLLDKVNTENTSPPNVRLGLREACGQPAYNRFSPDTNWIDNFIINSDNYQLIGTGSAEYLQSRNLIRTFVPSDNEFEITGFIVDDLDVVIQSNNTQLDFVNPLRYNLRLSDENMSSESCFSQVDPFRITIGVPIDLNLCGFFMGGSGISSESIGLEFDQEGMTLSQFLRLGFSELPENGLSSNLAFSNLQSPYDNNLFRAIVEVNDENEDDLVSAAQLNQELINLGVKSTIEYSFGNLTVRRFGPELNQAFFRVDSVGGAGGIDTRAFTQIGAGAGAGAGTASRNLIRDNFVRRVFEVVSAGSNPVGCVASNQLRLFSNPTPRQVLAFIQTCKPNPNVNLHYVNNTSSNRILLDYSVIGSFFNNNDVNSRTLVLVGYDIYFDSNIESSSNNFPSIVLFRNGVGVGGNVYIGPNVTELTGYLYADRSIFSVEDWNHARSSSTTGAPAPPTNFNSFYNEIAFIGRFFAENCVGCALESPPRRGDGSIARDFNEARPFDLNYFRFSSLIVSTVFEDGEEFYLDCDGENTFMPVGDGNEEDYLCWRFQGTGTEQTSPFLQSQRQDPNFRQADRRAVNFVFKPLSRTPVFTN